MARLLGPDGRPIDARLLAEEIAQPQPRGPRHTLSDRVATGLPPERLAMVRREAAAGDGRAYLTLAEEMEERYLHYASQVQTRRLAIDGVAVTVEVPDGVPKAIADAVHELVEADGFGDARSGLTDGIAKGYAVVELMWEYQERALRPVDYRFRDPRHFVFDRDTRTELRLATEAAFDEGEPLPPAKFIVHAPAARSGIPLRRGVARPAAWAFLVQSFTLKDWAAFAEIYGVPFRLGKYTSAASEDDRRTLLRAVRMIASDAAAIVPAGMDIEFHKVEGSHGAAVFGSLIDYVDRQVSKLVVGQTMTADDGSSLGQAKIHNEIRLDILEADCKQLARTLNRDLVRPFVALNFGPQALYPRVELHVPKPEDIVALTDSVAKLVPLGLRVGQRELRERLGLSEPQADEDTLQAPAAPEVRIEAGAKPAAPPRPPATLAADPGREPAMMPEGGVAEVDALAEAALSDWEAVADPLLDPLRAVLARATSFAEALAMLDAAGPDGTALAERLARATAIARGVGDVTDG